MQILQRVGRSVRLPAKREAFSHFSSVVGKTARAVEKETLESESSLEPEVAVSDADNLGSSTDVTPVKAEKVLQRKEKPARKRKSTQESSKVKGSFL